MDTPGGIAYAEGPGAGLLARPPRTEAVERGRGAMSTSDAVAGAAIGARGNPQAWRMRLVGRCPMEGRGDGMHINLKDGYAFFGHMGDFGIGTSTGQRAEERTSEIQSRGLI